MKCSWIEFDRNLGSRESIHLHRALTHRRVLRAELRDNFEIGSRGIGDDFRMPLVDSGEVSEIASPPECAGASLKKACSRMVRHAARRDQLQLREWREKRCEVAC